MGATAQPSSSVLPSSRTAAWVWTWRHLLTSQGSAAFLTAGTLLVVYLTLLPKGLTGEDAGELAVAAWHASVAHPSGYIVYSLVGWIWLLPARVWGGDPSVWLAAFSAFTMACAGYHVAQAAAALAAWGCPLSGSIGTDNGGSSSGSPRSDPTNEAAAEPSKTAVQRAAASLAAVLAGGFFGLNPWIVSQATIAEVYALAVLISALGLRLWVAALCERASDEARLLAQRRRVAWLAVLSGVGFGCHHAAVAVPMLLGVAILIRHPRLWLSARMWALGLAGGLVPATLVLGLMTWRALMTPDVSWLAPTDVESVVGFALRVPYTEIAVRNYTVADIIDSMGYTLATGVSWPVWGLPLAASLLVGVARSRWRYGQLAELVIVSVLTAAVFANHGRASALDASTMANTATFLLPMWMFVALWIGRGTAEGTARLGLTLKRRGGRIPDLPAENRARDGQGESLRGAFVQRDLSYPLRAWGLNLLALVLVASGTWLTPGGFPDRANNLPELLVRDAASVLPANAVVVAVDDAAGFPFLYARHVVGWVPSSVAVMPAHRIGRLPGFAELREQTGIPWLAALEVVSWVFPNRPLFVVNVSRDPPPGWVFEPWGVLQLARRVDENEVPAGFRDLQKRAHELIHGENGFVAVATSPLRIAEVRRELRPSWTDLELLTMAIRIRIEHDSIPPSENLIELAEEVVGKRHPMATPLVNALLERSEAHVAERLLRPLKDFHWGDRETTAFAWAYGLAAIQVGKHADGFAALEQVATLRDSRRAWSLVAAQAREVGWPDAEAYAQRALTASSP